MATKKAEPAATKEAAKTNEKDNWKTIIVPSVDGEPDEQYVAVNGKGYQIRRGVEVLVPPEVAEVIENSRLQMIEVKKNQKKFENQHLADFGGED